MSKSLGMQPDPSYHTSPNCLGYRVFGHLLEAGDVLEATDLCDYANDEPASEWSACTTPGVTLGEDAVAVWVRPIGLPEPVETSDEEEAADDKDPDPVVFELPEGKATLAYVPESNTCSFVIEGTANLGIRELTQLGQTFMQAAQYCMHRSGMSPIDLLRSLGIEVEEAELDGGGGCGRPDCESCSPENFADDSDAPEGTNSIAD